MHRWRAGSALATAATLVVAACGDGGGGDSATRRFSVRIENVSDESSLPSPLAPGLWAVSDRDELLFSPMAPDRGEGLEALAEDGDMLLDAGERDRILASRGKLEAALDSVDADEIRSLIEDLEAASKVYVARRMDDSVRRALGGRQIDEVDIR